MGILYRLTASKPVIVRVCLLRAVSCSCSSPMCEVFGISGFFFILDERKVRMALRLGVQFDITRTGLR